MADLFFGNRDVKVSITAAQTFNFDVLNKCILVTDEADIPIQILNGDSAVEDLETYLTDNTLTAPNLVAALTVFVGQSDNSGNSLVPEQVFVIGKDETDSSTNVDLITAAIEAAVNTNDFYCLIPCFESAPLNTWFQTWGASKNRIMHIFTATQNKALGDTEKSNRIIGIYDGAASPEFKNSAWAGRILNYGELIAWKFKKLNGVNTDDLGDGEVTSLEDAGWNGYRKVRGLGETTGSRTTQNTSAIANRIDEIYIRDNIIYNVANALSDTFKDNEIVTMGLDGRAKIKLAISAALNFAGSIGLIETFEDGSYKFKVDVPIQSSNAKSARQFQDVIFTYEPTFASESITVKGEEVLNFIQ